jgi:UbiD family decarboxylase
VAFNDLREWIDDLEERKDLKRVKACVDWDEEIGAITREVASRFGPALLFARRSPPPWPKPSNGDGRNMDSSRLLKQAGGTI